MNLVVTMLVLGIASSSVWAGITDPEGGMFAGLARGLRGESQTKRTANTSGFMATLAALTGTGNTVGRPSRNSSAQAASYTSSDTSSGTSSTQFNPPTASNAVSASGYKLGAVKPHVAVAAGEIGPLFGIGTVLGVGTRTTPNSDHPKGLALDFMTSNVTVGTSLATYALANRKRLRITYVIWRQRINSGDGRGWRPMEDRGSATANHMDHVHVSFAP